MDACQDTRVTHNHVVPLRNGRASLSAFSEVERGVFSPKPWQQTVKRRFSLYLGERHVDWHEGWWEIFSLSLLSFGWQQQDNSCEDSLLEQLCGTVGQTFQDGLEDEVSVAYISKEAFSLFYVTQ